MNKSTIKIIVAIIAALGFIYAAVAGGLLNILANLIKPNQSIPAVSVVNNPSIVVNLPSAATASLSNSGQSPTMVKLPTQTSISTNAVQVTITPLPEPTKPPQPPTITPLPPSMTPIPSTVTAVPTPTPLSLLVGSRFDGVGFDGWKINTGSLTNPGSGGGCGPDNGCLIFADSNENTSWWIAPKKFHGDWRVYAKLQIDLWSSGGKIYTDDFGDIYIVSGSAIAQRRLTERPLALWKTYEVPLEQDGEWELNGAQSLDDVLANVTEFQIRAEYGTGEDKSGLDNVALVP